MAFFFLNVCIPSQPNYVPTLEDEVETQRQKMFDELKKSGKKGTPVTEETLKAWLERKRQKRAEESKKLVEAELRKRKGGKGLSVLSGRDLYEFNKELFVDDENAADEKETQKNEENFDQDTPSSNKTSIIMSSPDALGLVTERIDTNLFLEGDDDDLDDVEDD